MVRLECVHDGTCLEWAAPARRERAPEDVQVIVVCVRYEYLEAVVDHFAGSVAPVLVMTPMMPQDFTRLSAALPGRLVVTMPSVVAYEKSDRVIRYWLPLGSTTLIESASAKHRPELVELIAKLQRAGIAARFEPEVFGRSVATTMSILPLAIAVDVAGGLDAALADDALLTLAQEAAEEGRRLGSTLGKAEPWASMLPSFAGPRILRAAAALARARLPEMLTYVHYHFEGKLHAQNLLLGARILELAKQKGVRCNTFERLMLRLEKSR
jgi:hypothetical protein